MTLTPQTRSRTPFAWVWAGLLALSTSLSVTPPDASAQVSRTAAAQALRDAAGKVISTAPLKEPVPYRVYQRDRDGRADVPVVLVEDDKLKDARVLNVRISGGGVSQIARTVEGVRFEDGKLRGVPTGGPYVLLCDVQVGEDKDNGPARLQRVMVQNVFVGDLWVLAGQSNMEGYGDLVDLDPPNAQVNALGMNGKWVRAEEPLHWLVDSPDPVHSGDPETRAKRSAEKHRDRRKGAGLGLPFATAVVQATQVPVGLVPCAHGGTSMGQWNPEKKDEGGKSLYGSMLRQVKLAGGKVRGVLWYQGESDANTDAAKAFPGAFTQFIAAVRSDLGQPELPFYFVQIGRFVRSGDPKPWNAVQEAQRKVADETPNTAVVSVIDLELDDPIHLGSTALKRAGHRLAKVALRELFGQAGATTPTLDRVNKGPGNSLILKFKGVSVGPDTTSPFGNRAPGMGYANSMGGGMGGMGTGGMGTPRTPADPVVGLKPARHIAGFSIRKEDGTELPLVFEAAVGDARDTVVLKLAGPVPEKAALWYGHGFDPYCNLTDSQGMAVPVFGPIPLVDAR